MRTGLRADVELDRAPLPRRKRQSCDAGTEVTRPADEPWAEVLAHAERIDGLHVMADQEVASLAAQFAERFVADPHSRWWWSDLRRGVSNSAFAYGNADPWALLCDWLSEDRAYVLLVTNEEPRPAGGLRGSLAALAELIGECPYFEYLVTDDAASFGVFDTHHNALIQIGPLPL